MRISSVLVFFISLHFSVTGQKKSDSVVTHIIKCHKIIFIAQDSVFNYYRITDYSGLTVFRGGNKDLACENGFLIKIDKHNHIESINEVYEIDPKVDTIYSYFPIDFKKGREQYLTDMHNAVIGSFILKLLNEPNLREDKSNTIRILSPYDDLNYSRKYEMDKIELHEHSMTMIISIVESNETGGYNEVSRDTFVLKKRDSDRIKETIGNLIYFESKECPWPGTPWYMEYSGKNGIYRYFIISFYCNRNRGDKDIPLIFRNYSLVMNIAMKYRRYSRYRKYRMLSNKN